MTLSCAGPGALPLAGSHSQATGQSPGLPSLALQTREERAEAGRALRRSAPRSAHAAWVAPASRPDPVALVLAQEAGRIAELLPRRHGLMAASPLAFLRGAASVMASDLAATPSAGPRVQACGDCHLMNFGAFSSPEGEALFDINDFDETLPAPFEWDVKRLAASLVLAGREAAGIGETGSGTIARAAVRAYAAELEGLAALDPLACRASRIDLAAAIAAVKGHGARRDAEARLHHAVEAGATQYGLLERDGTGWRLRGDVATMFRLPHHDAAVHAAFEAYRHTLQEDRRVLLGHFRLADWAFKVVGVGSVGTFCAVGLFLSGDGEPLLLQIKQATASVLAPFAGASEYAAQGERVVTGQRMMQAASDVFLGWARMPAGGAEGREHVYVRRLKDSRLAAVGARIEARSLASYAVLCGRTLARAHARSGDAALLSGYCGGAGFSRAVAGFAHAYADQATRDWRAFTDAIAAGRVSHEPAGTPAKTGGAR